MAEVAVVLTGVGGQGVQLAAQILARAATIEGRHVMLFGVYGGAMRGMNTDATVVIGTGPLRSPPIVSRAWGAIALHDRYWPPIAPRIRPGGLVLVNGATFSTALPQPRFAEVRVAASEVASRLGNELATSMVMIGAFTRVTGLVTLDGVVAGMSESIPPYRREHIAANETAIRAGFDEAPAATIPVGNDLAAHA